MSINILHIIFLICFSVYSYLQAKHAFMIKDTLYTIKNTSNKNKKESKSYQILLNIYEREFSQEVITAIFNIYTLTTFLAYSIVRTDLTLIFLILFSWGIVILRFVFWVYNARKHYEGLMELLVENLK